MGTRHRKHKRSNLAVGKGRHLIIHHIQDDSPVCASQTNNVHDTHLLVAHNGAIHDIKSFGNCNCVTTSFDGTSKLWDLNQHTCVGEFLGHQKQIYSVATCHEKHLLLSASYDHRINGPILALQSPPMISLIMVGLHGT